MDDLFDEWAGFGGFDVSPGIPTDFNWGNVDFGNIDLSNLIDLSSLKDFGFDLSGIAGLDLGNLNLGDLTNWGADVGLEGIDLGNIDLGGIGYDTGAFDLGGVDLGETDLSGISLDQLYQDLGDSGTLLGGIDGGVFGTEGFAGALDTPGYVYGTEGFADAADEVGGAGGYNEEDTKDKFWKELIGTGTAVPGQGEIKTVTYDDGSKQTIITRPDGSEEVLETTDTAGNVTIGPGGPGPSGPSTTGGTTGTTGGTTGGKTTTGTSTGGLNKDNALLMALLGGLLGLLSKGSAPKGPVGYQGGIPKYTAKRVPGRGVEYTRAATGGLMGLKKGQYLDGATDGMADKIQTSIEGKQPARLSHGEFVIPADVVSHLGNGNSDAGADVLYEMMAKVRKARTGTPKQGKQINPRQYTPA